MSWKERWVDQMGLIVTLSGEDRFKRLIQLKKSMVDNLSPAEIIELKECFRQRFTPTGGLDGCKTATESVNEIIK